MVFIDTHCHYEDEAFDEDRDAVIAKIIESGCKKFVDCAQDLITAEKILEISEKYPEMYVAVGIHPHEALTYSPEEMQKIKILAENKKVVAIGETGLDYHYDFAPRDVQKENFRANIRLAKELGLPVVVHDREAHQDTLDIMMEEGIEPGKAVVHCFSGSKEMAEIVSKNGWYFSFGGAVTFKNAKKFEEILPAIPKELLMLETDSPYMTPEPFRGRRNDSSNLTYIIEKISSILAISTDELASLTNDNSTRFFGLNN